MTIRSAVCWLRLITCLVGAFAGACNGKTAANPGDGGSNPDTDTGTSHEPDASPCTGAACYPCDNLSEAACGPQEVCFANRGQRLNSTSNCYQIRFGGCSPNLPCGGAMTTALDTEGACWIFPSTCLPAGFTYTDSQDPDCGYAQFDGLEECPAP